jgi:hypothetical protein
MKPEIGSTERAICKMQFIRLESPLKAINYLLISRDDA